MAEWRTHREITGYAGPAPVGWVASFKMDDDQPDESTPLAALVHVEEWQVHMGQDSAQFKTDVDTYIAAAIFDDDTGTLELASDMANFNGVRHPDNWKGMKP